ncbi:hypothetical protein [Desulfospira joergensenii]|uniref:hypothetical protein n=1 Tax=Desulfospira joergensenii TaxID=53329 RepID=UPI0003B3D30C|nr:hypothetical protein [Desulfospira joergensenii]
MKLITNIAAAVEEQSVSAREIAANMAQAAQGLQKVIQSASENSHVTGEIAGEVSEVNCAAKGMALSSSEINKSADTLSKVSEQLKSIVGQFKV